MGVLYTFFKNILNIRWYRLRGLFRSHDRKIERPSIIDSKPPVEVKPLKETPMYPKDMKNYEEIFETTKKDSDGTPYNIKIDASYPLTLKIIEPVGITGYFHPEVQPKSTIVLHFTVGFLTGDIGTLVEQGSYMSVPFVVGRNGTVYQLFRPDYWSYHLGKSAVGGNTYGSKRSIAIELSNIGPLTLKNTDLYSIYGSKYCSIEETAFYTTLQNPFRGYSYFATFTDQQYTALDKLVIHLCNKFNIPRNFLGEKKRYELFSETEAKEYKGICSHINFRGDGKVDIGPAFEWNKTFNL
jgi:N-acetyl-anhydromuramyl-L-alanine amidase AmpD